MVKEYKLKKGINPEEYGVEDFWYDLTDGGYIDPEALLDNEKDIKEVREAIMVLESYEKMIDINGLWRNRMVNDSFNNEIKMGQTVIWSNRFAGDNAYGVGRV